jgi:hypothetical protein
MVSNKNTKSGGYVVLLTVFVVGAVALSIAVTLLFSGVDLARNATLKEQSKQARALADACAEEALEQIRESQTFTGYGTLTLSTGSCGYSVTNLGGQNRQIAASSTVESAIRKVKLLIDQVKPTINVTSWQEVVD